jgi:hypothetical protein
MASKGSKHMRKITVSVDEETYRQIRAWCAHRDTCVSHVVQAFLDDLPRLSKVRRFPLPQAPDDDSLGARFDELSELPPGLDMF